MCWGKSQPPLPPQMPSRHTGWGPRAFSIFIWRLATALRAEGSLPATFTSPAQHCPALPTRRSEPSLRPPDGPAAALQVISPWGDLGVACGRHPHPTSPLSLVKVLPRGQHEHHRISDKETEAHDLTGLKPGPPDADSRAQTWPTGRRREGPACSYTYGPGMVAAGLGRAGRPHPVLPQAGA